MALTPAERMSRMRSRQRKAGLMPLSLVVPVGDAAAFTRLAARRRRLAAQARHTAVPAAARMSIPRGATTSISPGDILAFRELLESTAVSLVVRRLNPPMRRRLQAALRREAAVGIVDGGLDLDFHGFTGLFHGRGYLDDDAYALCARQYALLRALLPPPDLFIYLVAPVDVVVARYLRRNRGLEITTRRDLAELDGLVNTWMATVEPAHKLVVDATRSGFASAIPLAALQREIQLRIGVGERTV